MSDEPKKQRDPIDASWQPVAVVGLEPEARSVRNAVLDIGARIMLWATISGGVGYLADHRESQLVLWMAACGGIWGLAFGVATWLQRPIPR